MSIATGFSIKIIAQLGIRLDFPVGPCVVGTMS